MASAQLRWPLAQSRGMWDIWRPRPAPLASSRLLLSCTTGKSHRQPARLDVNFLYRLDQIPSPFLGTELPGFPFTADQTFQTPQATTSNTVFFFQNKYPSYPTHGQVRIQTTPEVGFLRGASCKESGSDIFGSIPPWQFL